MDHISFVKNRSDFRPLYGTNTNHV